MLTIVEAAADRWDNLAELLGERGDPSRCWCQYYRGDGAYQHGARENNRAALQRQISAAAIPHGLLAYHDEKPVGWCAVAPRADYPRLRQMRAAQATQDIDGLWSVTCFVVRVGYRRQGLTSRLLAAAIQFATQHGAKIIEAYPVDPTVRPTGSAGLYQGVLSTYLGAGFTEVARPSASRAIVRLVVTPTSGGSAGG
ncbi:MAG TPA: GNAT family N-acetyltransferase [Jatrophihabitans sp.]|nr:GNAT family N-acetyltransferase [Jatrophihabitans sp.]